MKPSLLIYSIVLLVSALSAEAEPINGQIVTYTDPDTPQSMFSDTKPEADHAWKKTETFNGKCVFKRTADWSQDPNNLSLWHPFFVVKHGECSTEPPL
jgi:hypothetical protein